MPDDSEVLKVMITTVPENRKKCKVAPNFVAKRGSTVTFVFDEFPNADITFTNGPFENDKLKPGSHKVRANVPRATPATDPVRFEYRVEWPGGGVGNGTGVVIGG